MLGSELGDEVGGEGGRVGERLVERLGHRRQQERGVGTEDELFVPRAVPLGHQPCVGQLVEAALLEPDRERPHRLCALRRRQRGQGRGVDAA